MRFVLALGVALIATTPASAQYFDPDQLAKVTAVEIAVEDSVRGECLPQPNALKTEAELILRRSGIKVTDGKGGEHSMVILAAGLFANGVCSASLGVDLWRFEGLDDGTRGLVEASNSSGVLVGPKSGFQQQLREKVNQRVTALANEILKARGQ